MGGQRAAYRTAFSLSQWARLRDRLGHELSGTDDDPGLVWAAVAIVIAPEPDSILLIRRADRAGDPWSGHMALPGGRREPGDTDLLVTAIRETQEEVGIGLRKTDVAGSLPDVIPRTPRLPPIAVRPFVFLLSQRPGVTPNPEVASASWVNLDHLLRADAHHPVLLDVAGQARQVEAYQLENAIVWGMTERILTSFLTYLRE
jgi:8-oxo-dGTP pyrophosphatase MutT (NUDIX family)